MTGFLFFLQQVLHHFSGCFMGYGMTQFRSNFRQGLQDEKSIGNFRMRQGYEWIITYQVTPVKQIQVCPS